MTTPPHYGSGAAVPFSPPYSQKMKKTLSAVKKGDLGLYLLLIGVGISIVMGRFASRIIPFGVHLWVWSATNIPYGVYFYDILATHNPILVYSEEKRWQFPRDMPG